MTTDRRSELADLASGAALSVAGVEDLYGGALGEIATFAPGGAGVPGVRVRTRPPYEVWVHVVAAYGRPLGQLADDVRAAVRRRLSDSLAAPGQDIRVNVRIESVREPVTAEQNQ